MAIRYTQSTYRLRCKLLARIQYHANWYYDVDPRKILGGW